MWTNSRYDVATNRFHWNDASIDNGKRLKKNGTSNGNELKLSAVS